MAIKVGGELNWNKEQSEVEHSDDNLFSTEEDEINDEKSKFQKFFDSIKNRGKRDGLKLFLLVLSNGLYLYIGGIIFYLLERKPKRALQTTKYVEMFINILKNSSSSIDFASSRMVVNSLKDSELHQMKTLFNKAHEELTIEHATTWTLTNAVFFASTVVTTIGYGNLAPETVAGRCFCVLYAIIGIPLTLILLAMVGRILSKYINDLCGFILNYMKKYLYPDYEYDSTDGSTDLNAPVWLAISFIMVFISLDAIVIMYLEDWSFPISLYFIFITLTTIGFGDIVPHNTAVVWFNVTLMYIGLAAISITINLLIANISIQYRKHKQKIKFVSKIEKQLDSDDDHVSERTPLNIDINENNQD